MKLKGPSQIFRAIATANAKLPKFNLKNPESVIAMLNARKGDDAMSIRAPGVVNIPMCSLEEALANWKQGVDEGKPGNFPCN